MRKRASIRPPLLNRSHLIGIVAALTVACGNPGEFEAPKFPIHDEEEGGRFHARRYENPFLCGSEQNPDGEDGVPCPTDGRPANERLSCDASGCHGNYEYGDPSPIQERGLHGNIGPSCYTCHGKKWDE